MARVSFTNIALIWRIALKSLRSWALIHTIAVTQLSGEQGRRKRLLLNAPFHRLIGSSPFDLRLSIVLFAQVQPWPSLDSNKKKKKDGLHLRNLKVQVQPRVFRINRELDNEETKRFGSLVMSIWITKPIVRYCRHFEPPTLRKRDMNRWRGQGRMDVFAEMDWLRVCCKDRKSVSFKSGHNTGRWYPIHLGSFRKFLAVRGFGGGSVGSRGGRTVGLIAGGRWHPRLE